MPILEARGIVRTYGQVVALDGADFDVEAGEVTALIGDNGAGEELVQVVIDLGGVLTAPGMLDEVGPDGGELPPTGGTGLSLALARGLCEAMGATLAVQTEPGQGSRFSTRLERAEGAPAHPQQ